MYNHKKIYKAVLGALSVRALTRRELIDRVTERLSDSFDVAVTYIGEYTELRGAVGSVVSEMEDLGVITPKDGRLILTQAKPVALRAENCEKEILSVLTQSPMTKQALRSTLENRFGTNKTPSLRDDNTLYSLIGQVLKRLTKLGIIEFNDGEYRVAPTKMARIDDINAMLSLKADFITRIHSKGGEFFEHYIMTLLGKYMAKHGKRIIENRTTGGSADGGIDGLMKTEDTLGFRETIMVQAKNRIDMTNERTARSFYGAVCAAQGSRGIFATTSDFHPSAKEFFDGIDNCVAINGDMIFHMAIECQYGCKRRGGKYVIDTKIL